MERYRHRSASRLPQAMVLQKAIRAERSFVAKGFTVDHDIGVEDSVGGKVLGKGTLKDLLCLVIGDIRRDQTQAAEKPDGVGIDDKDDPAKTIEQNGIRGLLANAMTGKQIAAKFICVGGWNIAA